MRNYAKPGRSEHIIIQVIRSVIGKLRQRPGFYPARFYKKNRSSARTVSM